IINCLFNMLWGQRVWKTINIDQIFELEDRNHFKCNNFPQHINVLFKA
uniref:Uncharacterized protein n=1 Tax=Parascaris univalens TaxID=6257 RepID=A0A915BIW0_PARUN